VSKLPNIGPKSAAWLRQVGLRTQEDLAAVGPVEAYVKVRRAGFRPSLNLLYAIEGALTGCHWQQVPEPRRQQLVREAEVRVAALPDPRKRPPAPVSEHRPGSVAESAADPADDHDTDAGGLGFAWDDAGDGGHDD
jgi:hypothetical protein